MSKTVEKTPAEILKNFEEQKTKAYLSLLKNTLIKNEEFVKLKEAFAKTKRYLAEAESILTQEGFDKAQKRISEKIDELTAELNSLTEKRNVAAAAVNTLRASVTKQEAEHKSLSTALMKVVEGDMSLLTDDGAINSAVSQVLKGIQVTEVTDPFAKFRS